jgi:UDP-N-acetylmuramate dehydrogenase
LNCDGSAAIVSGLQAGFGYRSCEALRGRTAVAVRLRLEPSSRDEVRARRLSCRARRLDLVGLRTAGSVFRNPPGGFAGRLLEEAGCKGMSVGGAAVLGRHANVIAAGDGATASDVEALMALMWWRVWRAKGVALVPEVRVLSGETRWDASGRSRF